MSRPDRSFLLSAGVAQTVERVQAVAFGGKKNYDGTVPHVTAWAGRTKYHTDGFLFDWVYHRQQGLKIWIPPIHCSFSPWISEKTKTSSPNNVNWLAFITTAFNSRAGQEI